MTVPTSPPPSGKALSGKTPSAKPPPVWRQIHAALLADISEGRYRAGDKLPTEAALSDRFGVNRHTVRRSLAALQEAGLVTARRGAGVFVNHKMVDYQIGTRTRFSQNINQMGMSGSRTVHRLESLPAGQEEAAALDIAQGALVHVLEASFHADGTPLVTGQSFFPGARFPDLLDLLQAETSITRALNRAGLADYRRASTRVTAELASGTLARHLHVPEGAALIRTRSVNVDPEGRPVEYGRSWFAADRVEFVVDESAFSGPG